jgi:hypothetical protein
LKIPFIDRDIKTPMKAGFANVALCLSSILFVLGLAEIATRLTWTEHSHGLYQVAPDGLRLVPHSEGRYKSEEFEFIVTANRFGYRDREWTEQAINNSSNIIFAGDSFVFGYGVGENETVPSFMEQLSHGAETAHPMEVFNVGLAGTFPEYRAQARGAIEIGIQARTILVGLFLGNDFTEIPVYSRAPVQATTGKSLRAPSRADSALYRFLKSRIGSSATFTGFLFTVSNWLQRDLYPTSAGYIFLRDWTKAQQGVFYYFLDQSLDIARLTAAHGRDLVFVIFPNRIQVENSRELTNSVYDADLPNQRILEYCRLHQLSCLDLLPDLRDAYTERREPLYFPIDRHLNATGNRIAADRILEYLRRERSCCDR